MCKADAIKHVQAINTEIQELILQIAGSAFQTKLREKKTRQLAQIYRVQKKRPFLKIVLSS